MKSGESRLTALSQYDSPPSCVSHYSTSAPKTESWHFWQSQEISASLRLRSSRKSESLILVLPHIGHTGRSSSHKRVSRSVFAIRITSFLAKCENFYLIIGHLLYLHAFFWGKVFRHQSSPFWRCSQWSFMRFQMCIPLLSGRLGPRATS